MTHVAMNRMFGGGRHNVQKVCVDVDPQGFKRKISNACGRNVSTFPQIFIDNRYVGGYSDFCRAFPDAA